MLKHVRKVVSGFGKKVVWCEKARKHMCVTDRHDIILAVNVALTLSQTISFRLPNRKSLQTTILNLMKMQESSMKGEKTLRKKEEIARHEQFLLFPQCFQKTCTADT